LFLLKRHYFLVGLIAIFGMWLSACQQGTWTNRDTRAPSVRGQAAQAEGQLASPTAQPTLPIPTQTAPALLPASPTPVPPTKEPPMSTSSPTPLPAEQIRALTARLIRSAEAGDTAAVLNLIKEGADKNGQDELGRTPLMAATHANQVDTVRVLIEAGADINIRDNRLDNPFLYAGAEGQLEILRLAIAAKADTRLTNRFGGTALIPAAERGHVEIVQELLAHTDVDVNHVNNLGWTALLEAILLGEGGSRHIEIVRLLVAAGADVNLADANGVTPLAHARQRGQAQISAILEQAGAR
jgi:uncharacterized protein